MIKRIINKLGLYATYKIAFGQKKFSIPIFNKLGFANFKSSESWMLSVIEKLGHEDVSFLDVGVNVGQTLLSLKSVYPNSNYIGVEPNTDCVCYVNKLIYENKIKNTIVLPVGLGSETKLNFLYRSKTDPSDSTASTIENFRNEEDRLSIPIVTIPFDLLKNHKFDIIKIDVEGGELEIIESIFKSINCNSIFICEILPVYKKENKIRLERQLEIENILKTNNYLIYRIIKKPKVTLEKVTEFGIHSKLDACDYIFIPKSNVSLVIEKFK
jgi:FkbM family methyltransferase